MTSNNETKFAFFSESKGIGDLKDKNYVELKELLVRQEHLLSNKILINKLNDKGIKIRKVKSEIEKELEHRKSNNNGRTKKVFENSSAAEWRDTENTTENTETIDVSDIEDETNAVKILSENGQIPQIDKSKLHINRLLEKEKDQNFSFKPYNPAVAEKIKNVIPDARTLSSSSLVKTIHLDESLNLLTDQMSAIKILGSRSKRVEECIEDRMNEGGLDHELDNEETEERERKEEYL